MFNFIQNIIYSILSLQEKTLAKKLRKKIKSSISNSTTKVVFGKAASLNLSVKTEQNKERLKHDVANILKKYENNPNKLLKFIEKNGTEVHRIHFANKILALIGYEEGFIPALGGLKALYISAIISIASQENKISLKTKPMFVLRHLELNNYYMIQQFHKWYAMKLNLPGFDTDAQTNFQKFLSPQNDSAIKDLTMDEILGLKEAIARDVEAINFVVELARNTDGTRKAMQKITTGGASV